MRHRRLRLASILAFMMFLAVGMLGQVEHPDPGGGGGRGGLSCYICRGVVYEGGASVMYCTSPDLGGWGSQYCDVGEVGDGRYYCNPYGNPCCVD